MKTCTKCGEEKPYSEYYKNAQKKGGYYNSCKICYRIHRDENQYNRRAHLKYKYGLSLAQYDVMLEEQGGVCAVCGRSNGSKRLFIDHDHATGEVRGLLCHACNITLGNVDDNEELLLLAVEYLRKWKVQSDV